MRPRLAGRVCGGTLLAAAVLASAHPRAVAAQEFHVDREADRRVAFISETTLDTFEGVTDRIDGYVLLPEGELGSDGPVEGELYFEVDLASLDTGIGLRNRHMRENYLEVADHPYATFEARLTRIDEDGSGGWEVTAEGTFAVHGVRRARTITCGVTPDGRGYRASCGFLVELSRHDIDIPRLMFMKLAEEVRLELDFRLRPAG